MALPRNGRQQHGKRRPMSDSAGSSAANTAFPVRYASFLHPAVAGTYKTHKQVPDTIRLDMLREALPVVQKMITEYKKQLGDRDEITQQAIAHHWHLLRMLPKSHAYPEDGTVDPTTVTTEIQPAGSLPSTASGLGFKGFGRSASKAMDAGGAAGGTGKEKRVSDKPGVTSLVTNLMANVKMSAPWSPSTPDRPLRLDDILSEQDKGLASRLTPGIGR
ncbi:hypothetical protein BC828DRAFT_380678 [Blastocladiella britannica]|nr:hypothetical protein BC828DRAFT_380678 [Blastocladiella britannica]